jgi:thiol-disulfide isomerase/thioredoxin
MPRKSLSIVISISILFFCLLFTPLPGYCDNAAKFALLNEKDNLITLSSLTQKNNLIVAFWASYCVPCRREIPQLVDLENKYGKEKNIRLVLINIDKEGKEVGLPALKEINVSKDCLFDMYQLAVKSYAPNLEIPATFLINKKGEIVFKVTGESNENIKKLEAAVLKMK